MRRSLSAILTLGALSFSTGLTCRAQSAGAPTPTPGKPPVVEPRAAAESKERAEDAELLRQLDKESQQLDEESQQWRTDAKVRAEGAGRGRAKGGMAISPDVIQFNRQTILTRPSGASRALVIRTGEPDAKSQSALEEDLAVMSHLLDKAVEDLPGGQGNGNRAMGIDVFFAPSSAPVRSLYVDNYGALFFLKVNFSLMASTEKHQEQKAPGDSAWEEARQELYGQRLQGNGAGEPGEEFSQEKVDKLKETLFETLKNASNIRGLKPEDYVTICVSGGSGSSGRVRMAKGAPAAVPAGNFIFAGQPGVPARRSVLTLRARKSDIDGFSKGSLNLEQFQKCTVQSAYSADATSGSAEAVASGSYTVRAK